MEDGLPWCCARFNKGVRSILEPIRQPGYDFGRRRIDQGELAMNAQCAHAKEIRKVEPSGSGCKECLEMGDSWVHLRLCLLCGHVGCCDSSKNKHATKHFHETHHPIVQSFEPGEDWRWCYVDEILLE